MHMPKATEREQGFTLIELLVVIIIIGILAAIAIPLFLDQRKLAVDASVKSDVRNTLANIKTWQANDANANKAVANTGDFISAANGGKVAQSPGNSIGISISSTGDATVCGYNASGKTYLSDSASYLFSPSTGQFTTGSCATGSTTGGVASTGSSSGGSGTTSNPLNGGYANGAYTATLETGDPTNGMWSVIGSKPGAIVTDKYNTGAASYAQVYTASEANFNETNTSLSNRAQIRFTPSPALAASTTYKVTAWVYNTGGGNTYLGQINASGGDGPVALSSAAKQWVKITANVSSTNAAGGIFFMVGDKNATTTNTLYVDDLTVVPY